MLNERAAVAGQANKAAIQLQAFNSKIATLQRQLAMAQTNSLGAVSRLTAATATLGGLDTSIALMYQEVRPDAAGVVNAWSNKYGRRGGLKAFLTQALKDAAPLPVSTPRMLLAVVAHFGISVANPYDRGVLQRSVKGTLQQIHSKGLIEPLHNRTKSNTPGIWRWVQPPHAGRFGGTSGRYAGGPC